jgi:hypothetical protein
VVGVELEQEQVLHRRGKRRQRATLHLGGHVVERQGSEDQVVRSLEGAGHVLEPCHSPLDASLLPLRGDAGLGGREHGRRGVEQRDRRHLVPSTGREKGRKELAKHSAVAAPDVEHPQGPGGRGKGVHGEAHELGTAGAHGRQGGEVNVGPGVGEGARRSGQVATAEEELGDVVAGPEFGAVEGRSGAQPGWGPCVGAGRQRRTGEEPERAHLLRLESILGPVGGFDLPGQDLGKEFGPDGDVGRSKREHVYTHVRPAPFRCAIPRTARCVPDAGVRGEHRNP